MSNAAAKRPYRDLTTGTEWKQLLLFALPIMLGQLLQQLYSTVDGIVVGNFVSSGALAAVGSCTTMSMIFLGISFGMSNGGCIVISQFFGAGREDDMRAAAANIFFLMTCLGLIATAVGALTAHFLTTVVLDIQDPAIQQQAEVYFRIFAIGFLSTYIYNTVAATLRAVGDSRAVLYFLLVSTVANTALDLLFVCVFRWGVAGAAWATVIAQVACVIVSIVYMFRRYPTFRFTGWKQLEISRAKMKLFLEMGIPSTLQHLAISSGHVLMQRLVNSFGEATMAAVTVGSRYDHYCSIPILGINQASASFAGQNTGAGKYDRVKRGLYGGICIDLAFIAVINTALYIFAEPLAGLFGVDGEALHRAVEYLRFLCFAFIPFAIYIPINGTFQGCGEPLAAAFVSLIALSLRVGCSYVMVLAFHMDYHALWITYAIGWTGALIFAASHFATGKWKTKSLIKDVPAEEQKT